MLALAWTSWVEGILTCVTVIHHTILLTTTSLQIKELSEAYKSLRLSLFRAVILIILCNLLWNVVNILLVFFELNHKIFGCWFFYSVIMSIYYIGKCSIWYYNILRLEVVFARKTNLNYDPSLLKSLKIAFIITAMLLSISCIVGMTPYHNGQGRCVLLFKLWANATIIIPDTIMSCLCYWLFHRKMKKVTALYKSMQDDMDQGSENKVDSHLLYVLRKFTILCATTIISTWIAGGIAIIAPSMSMVMGVIDSIINVWCILLYDVRYDRIYLFIFGCIAKSHWKIETEIKLMITGNPSNTKSNTTNTTNTTKSNPDSAVSANTDNSNTDKV